MKSEKSVSSFRNNASVLASNGTTRSKSTTINNQDPTIISMANFIPKNQNVSIEHTESINDIDDTDSIAVINGIINSASSSPATTALSLSPPKKLLERLTPLGKFSKRKGKSGSGSQSSSDEDYGINGTEYSDNSDIVGSGSSDEPDPISVPVPYENKQMTGRPLNEDYEDHIKRREKHLQLISQKSSDEVTKAKRVREQIIARHEAHSEQMKRKLNNKLQRAEYRRMSITSQRKQLAANFNEIISAHLAIMNSMINVRQMENSMDTSSTPIDNQKEAKEQPGTHKPNTEKGDHIDSNASYSTVRSQGMPITGVKHTHSHTPLRHHSMGSLHKHRLSNIEAKNLILEFLRKNQIRNHCSNLHQIPFLRIKLSVLKERRFKIITTFTKKEHNKFHNLLKLLHLPDYNIRVFLLSFILINNEYNSINDDIMDVNLIKRSELLILSLKRFLKRQSLGAYMILYKRWESYLDVFNQIYQENLIDLRNLVQQQLSDIQTIREIEQRVNNNAFLHDSEPLDAMEEDLTNKLQRLSQVKDRVTRETTMLKNLKSIADIVVDNETVSKEKNSDKNYLGRPDWYNEREWANYVFEVLKQYYLENKNIKEFFEFDKVSRWFKNKSASSRIDKVIEECMSSELEFGAREITLLKIFGKMFLDMGFDPNATPQNHQQELMLKDLQYLTDYPSLARLQRKGELDFRYYVRSLVEVIYCLAPYEGLSSLRREMNTKSDFDYESRETFDQLLSIWKHYRIDVHKHQLQTFFRIYKGLPDLINWERIYFKQEYGLDLIRMEKLRGFILTYDHQFSNKVTDRGFSLSENLTDEVAYNNEDTNSAADFKMEYFTGLLVKHLFNFEFNEEHFKELLPETFIFQIETLNSSRLSIFKVLVVSTIINGVKSYLDMIELSNFVNWVEFHKALEHAFSFTETIVQQSDSYDLVYALLMNNIHEVVTANSNMIEPQVQAKINFVNKKSLLNIIIKSLDLSGTSVYSVLSKRLEQMFDCHFQFKSKTMSFEEYQIISRRIVKSCFIFEVNNINTILENLEFIWGVNYMVFWQDYKSIHRMVSSVKS